MPERNRGRETQLAFSCLVFSRAAVPVARQIGAGIRTSVAEASDFRIFGPEALVERNGLAGEVAAFASVGALLAGIWRSGQPIIFIGATGIAVRAIAPFISHKSIDPPVIVVDTAARYVISLIGGHAGGANELARRIAAIIGAEPVVTTASESTGSGSLDETLLARGLKILDWHELPRLQAHILENRPVPLDDPYDLSGRESGVGGECRIIVDWRRSESQTGLLRVAIPLWIGIGSRRDVTLSELEQGYREFLAKADIEPLAVAGLATVQEKAELAGALARKLELPLLAYTADTLAGITTPGRSEACGKRFGTRPFSVCEAAALLAAGTPASLLAVAKNRINGSMTFAAAMKTAR